MNGAVHVESREGEGSRFAVKLDFTRGEPQGSEATAAIELPPLRILVVEDEPVNRLVVRELLGARGHRVETVDRGEAALDIVTGERFDLVLMDLSMPGIDGLETTRRLRAAGCRTPVIGLTAHVLPEHNRACELAGMDAVLHKPLDLGKFDALAEKLLARGLVNGAEEQGAGVRRKSG